MNFDEYIAQKRKEVEGDKSTSAGQRIMDMAPAAAPTPEQIEPGVMQGMRPTIDPIAALTGAGAVGGMAGALNTGMAQDVGGAVAQNPQGFLQSLKDPATLIHHGLPMALQMALSYAGRGMGGGVGQAIGSGLGSAGGYLFQTGAEPMMKGEAPTSTVQGTLGSGVLGGALDAGMQAGGVGGRVLSGKAGMLSAGQSAAEEAGQGVLAANAKFGKDTLVPQAEAAKAAAEESVATAQTRLQGQVLKNSEDALAGVRTDEVAKQVKDYLGPAAVPEQPTIESLSANVTPIRQSAQKNVASVFKGLSQKFDDHLETYGEIPLQNDMGGNFQPVVDAQNDIIKDGGIPVSRKLSGAMDQLAALDIGDSTTISQVDAVRKQLTGVVIGRGSATDRRIANNLLQQVDKKVGEVLPPEAATQWQVLRNEWHEANNVFSPTFRSTLFKAKDPEDVANVLYDAGKDNANRVLTVINKTPPDELPLLRSAFAEKLTQGNVLENVDKVDPRVFRQLYPDTGFDTPQAWKEALGQKVDYNAVMSNPVLQKAFQNKVQDGMRSAGMRPYQEAMDKAEQILKSTPNAAARIQQALSELPESQTRPGVAAERAGVTAEQANMRPLPLPTWVDHRIKFHAALALTAIGSWGAAHLTSHPLMYAAPFAYLGAGKALSGALATYPSLGKLYYNALKSKTLEQRAFLFGRLAVAGLSDATRNANQ